MEETFLVNHLDKDKGELLYESQWVTQWSLNEQPVPAVVYTHCICTHDKYIPFSFDLRFMTAP